MTMESEWVVCSPLLSVDSVEPVVQVYICLGCGFYVLEPSDECPECKASMGSEVLPVDDLGHIEACDLIEKIAATHIKQATRAESERFQESVPFIRGNPSHPSNRRHEQTKRNQSFSRKQRLLKQIALCKRKG